MMDAVKLLLGTKDDGSAVERRADLRALAEHSRYFMALIDFDGVGDKGSVDISCPGVSASGLEWAISVALDETDAVGGFAEEEEEEADSLEALKASVYLQCEKAEQAATCALMACAGTHNCFQLAQAGWDTPGCDGLLRKAGRFCVDLLTTLNWRPGSWEEVMRLEPDDLRRVAVEEVADSTVALALIVGWYLFDDANRGRHVQDLVDAAVVPELLWKETLRRAPPWKEALPGVMGTLERKLDRYLARLTSCTGSTAEESRFRLPRLSWLMSSPRKRVKEAGVQLRGTASRKWPKMVVTHSSFPPGRLYCYMPFLTVAKWTLLAQLPEELWRKEETTTTTTHSRQRACCVDRTIYVINSSAAAEGAMWAYHIDKDRWEVLPPPPRTLDSSLPPLMAVLGRRIYLSSRYVAAQQQEESVPLLPLCFHVDTKRWTTDPSVWPPTLDWASVFGTGVAEASSGRVRVVLTSQGQFRICDIDSRGPRSDHRRRSAASSSSWTPTVTCTGGGRAYLLASSPDHGEDNSRIKVRDLRRLNESGSFPDLPAPAPAGTSARALLWHDGVTLGFLGLEVAPDGEEKEGDWWIHRRLNARWESNQFWKL